MKDNSFDFIKDIFENSGVNAPDDINEQLVLDKLEGDVPELTVLPPKRSKKKLVAGISAVAAAAVVVVVVLCVGFAVKVAVPSAAPQPAIMDIAITALSTVANNLFFMCPSLLFGTL